MASIVYIHLGRHLPWHLADSIAQVRSFGSEASIFLVAEQRALPNFRAIEEFGVTAVALEDLGVSEHWDRFRRTSRLDRKFREAFWTLTTERFFALERTMRALDLRNVIHIENDVMIYFDVGDMVACLAPLYPNLAATFANDATCVPGLVYVAHPDSLVPLLEHINTQVGRRRLRQWNDMLLLGGYRALRGSEFIDTLPIVPPEYSAALRTSSGRVPKTPADYSNNFQTLRGVFDAAALGQYLGGTDPRNAPGATTVGYVNQECVFDPSRCRLTFERDEKGRRYPALSAGGPFWPVFNLHVHSKLLARFAS